MGIESETTKTGRGDMITSLVQSNPQASADEVVAALRALRELREKGITGAGYNLRSPYGRSVTHSASEESWAAAK